MRFFATTAGRAQASNDIGPVVLRYRTPVLAAPDTKGYERVLKIVWCYADDNTGAMPSADDSELMADFENRFCDAVEQDATAILTAVLTFDGARVNGCFTPVTFKSVATASTACYRMMRSTHWNSRRSKILIGIISMRKY